MSMTVASPDLKAFLLATHFFGGLSDSSLDLLVSMLVERRFEAGATVVAEGEQGRSMFIVHSGKLEVSRHYVAIECKSDLTRGMTVVDRLGVATDPRNSRDWSGVIQRDQRIEICWKLDVPGWKAALIDALKR